MFRMLRRFFRMHFGSRSTEQVANNRIIVPIQTSSSVDAKRPAKKHYYGKPPSTARVNSSRVNQSNTPKTNRVVETTPDWVYVAPYDSDHNYTKQDDTPSWSGFGGGESGGGGGSASWGDSCGSSYDSGGSSGGGDCGGGGGGD
jgi:hypothetical protein